MFYRFFFFLFRCKSPGVFPGGWLQANFNHVLPPSFYSKIFISLTQQFTCAHGRLYSSAKWQVLVSTLLEHGVRPQFWFRQTWTNLSDPWHAIGRRISRRRFSPSGNMSAVRRLSDPWPTVKMPEMHAILQLVLASLNPIPTPIPIINPRANACHEKEQCFLINLWAALYLAFIIYCWQPDD